MWDVGCGRLEMGWMFEVGCEMWDVAGVMGDVGGGMCDVGGGR